MTVIDRLAGGLIVSCQAPEGDPLAHPECMAAMAKAAALAGAVGIRANGPADIRAIRAAVELPIIGIYKLRAPHSPVYITPTFQSAQAVSQAGADIIAIDATQRPRPDGSTLEVLIRRIHEELGLPVMADVSTLQEGILAAQAGADIVASTLSGYTENSPAPADGEPDLDLIRDLVRSVAVPVIAEGRFHRPELAAAALDRGAHAVVVGTAITRPQWIAEQFVRAIAGRSRAHLTS